MQNYTEQILVRLKKGQNEILKQEASKYHLPVSSYVRLLLFKEEKEIIWLEQFGKDHLYIPVY